MTDQTVHRDAKNEAADRWAGLILSLTRRSGTDPRPELDRTALARVVAGQTGATMAHVREFADTGDWKGRAHETPDLSDVPGIKPNYPSHGRFAVAGWAWMYTILREAVAPIDLQSLASVVSALTDMNRAAAENLLHEAAREGLLERDRHNVGGRSRSTVYLKDAYR